MLEAELQLLRDENTAIAALLQELENSLALPLPPEPPFQVMSDVSALQDRVYAMARRVGSMKRVIRDRQPYGGCLIGSADERPWCRD